MIRINLLPVELRRGNRLSAKVVAVAFGAAVATSAAIGWFGIVYFGDLGAAETALADVSAKLTEKEKRVVYHGKLEVNKADYGSRVQTIQDIGRSRRLWSRFCDELVDVVNNNGDTDRHLAWFDNLVAKNDAVKGATVQMRGHVQDGEASRVANLHEDIENSAFGKELASKSPPSWRREEDKDRMPSVSLGFPLAMTFKPTVKEAPKGGAKTPANAKK